jgi:uncharacterized protein (DUF2147 family)
MDSFTKDLPIIKRGSVGTRLYMIKSGSSRVVTGSAAFGADEDQILGLWSTTGNNSRVEIFKCGEN